MDALQKQDVPYGNDWDSAVEAAAYGEAADQARRWRAEIRDHIAARVATLAPRARVLELGPGTVVVLHGIGSGSGYLAPDLVNAGPKPCAVLRPARLRTIGSRSQSRHRVCVRDRGANVSTGRRQGISSSVVKPRRSRSKTKGTENSFSVPFFVYARNILASFPTQTCPEPGRPRR